MRLENIAILVIPDRPRCAIGTRFASRNSELEFHSFHVERAWPSERSLHSNNTCRPVVYNANGLQGPGTESWARDARENRPSHGCHCYYGQ